MIPPLLRPPLLALAVMLGGSVTFEPQVLTLDWPDRSEIVAATSPATCKAAIAAIAAGNWLADDPPLRTACDPGNAFAPGSDCIENYNCPRRR